VNVKIGKLSELKSHDYHIIMKRLVSITFRGYLNHEVCKVFAELIYVYRYLCAKEIMTTLFLLKLLVPLVGINLLGEVN
jgi:hypothetical protein